MTLATGRSKLIDSTKVLTAHWEAVRDGWGDRACEDFEEEHVAPITPHVQSAIRAADRLSAILAQMRHECG